MSVGFREAAPVEIPAVTPEDVADSVNYVINTPYHCNVRTYYALFLGSFILHSSWSFDMGKKRKENVES